MRKSCLPLLALLAACELQPPPKQAPAPRTPPQAAQPVPPPPPPTAVQAGSGSGSAALMEVTDQCVAIGAHIARVIVESTTDPAMRSIYEQERTKMIRSTAEVCTTQKWSPEASACYLATKTAAEIKACEQKFAPPRPQPRPIAPDNPPGTEQAPRPAAVPPAG